MCGSSSADKQTQEEDACVQAGDAGLRRTQCGAGEDLEVLGVLDRAFWKGAERHWAAHGTCLGGGIWGTPRGGIPLRPSVLCP